MASLHKQCCRAADNLVVYNKGDLKISNLLDNSSVKSILSNEEGNERNVALS
jgi:hypothetical protein